MGSRLLPYQCPRHNVTVSYGDFGTCQGYCAENGHAPADCPDEPGCEECEADDERERIARDQELLDLRRANRANRSRWKNARRDFLAVRAERDALAAVLRKVVRMVSTDSFHGRHALILRDRIDGDDKPGTSSRAAWITHEEAAAVARVLDQEPAKASGGAA